MTAQLIAVCLSVLASSAIAWLVLAPSLRVAPKWASELTLMLERVHKRLDVIEARITVPRIDEAARRRELAERSVAYADQLGGPRAQRLAHALGAFRMLAPANVSTPDNVARIEIEAVLARRKPPPLPGAGEKRVAP